MRRGPLFSPPRSGTWAQEAPHEARGPRENQTAGRAQGRAARKPRIRGLCTAEQRERDNNIIPWLTDAEDAALTAALTRLATLTVENESLQSDVDFMDTALIMARQYLKAGRPDDALGVLDALEEKP